MLSISYLYLSCINNQGYPFCEHYLATKCLAEPATEQEGQFYIATEFTWLDIQPSVGKSE